MKALRGIAVSPGYANGTVVVYRPPSLEGVRRGSIKQDQIDGEFKRFTVALEAAVEEVRGVRQQVAADVGEGEAAIFDAHEAMLCDPALKENIHGHLRRRLICSEAALADEMKAFSDRLSSSGSDYMRELVMDAHDVGNRLLRHLCGGDQKGLLAELPPGSVIVAHDLMPSETVGMDRRNVAGIASERGGPTSHAAILARSIGVPAVTGLTGLLDLVQPGEVCLLDGGKGSMVLQPSKTQRQRFAVRRREFEQSRTLMSRLESKACRLKNGTRIQLMANINQAVDVELTGAHNLDGIGLYRTELMYLTARSAPSPAAQARHYARAAAACGNTPATIRTFDFAVDKHPAFLSVDTEASLELRGLRFALHQSRLFKSQLRAIVRTARAHPNIRMLFPMVTGWWELEAALKMVHALAEEEGLEQIPAVGAMIETPAAIYALPEIVKLVDFISIGCNDLAQYTLAMERTCSAQALSGCFLHPSLLRAVRQIVDTAARKACPVSVCGEAASDPVMAAILTGLGVRGLSVCPVRAPVVRYALRHLTLSDARRAAAFALQADPASVATGLEDVLPAELKSLLVLESGRRDRSLKL